MTVPGVDDALLARAAACRTLINAGAIDPALGLSLVVWPPDTLLQASKARAGDQRQKFSTEERADALDLVAPG